MRVISAATMYRQASTLPSCGHSASRMSEDPLAVSQWSLREPARVELRRTSRNPLHRRPLRLSLQVLFVVALASSIGGCGTEGRPLTEKLAGLDRRVTPRLSIEVRYGRCTDRTPVDGSIQESICGTSPGSAQPPVSVLNLSTRVADVLRVRVDPDALNAAALLSVLWADGSGGELQESISQLQTASRLTDQPAPVLVDLAAAYLVRAERTQSTRDLLQALETAEQAVRLDPRSQAASFNLALAMDRLGLDGQAEKEWRHYLELDRGSPWAEEATLRLRQLKRRFTPPQSPPLDSSSSALRDYVSRAPQQVRFLGWDRLLGAWGAAVLRNDSARATKVLHCLTQLGEELERQGGDATLADAVRAIHRHKDNGPSIRRLAEAHRAYAAGRSAFEGLDHAAAERWFSAALRASDLSETLGQWASLYRGASQFYLGRPEDAARLIAGVAERVNSTRHPALAAHAHWMTGTVNLRTGRYQRAEAEYRSSIRRFMQIGEREHLGAVHAFAAEAAFALGDEIGAYEAMHRSLMLLRPYRASPWLHNLLYVLAQAATTERLTRASARIQDEGVAAAASASLPVYHAEALLSRARIHAATGDTLQAVRDLNAGKRIVEALEPGELRSWFEQDLRFARASVAIRDRPASVATALDSVVAFFAASRTPLRLLPTLVLRAESRLSAGDAQAAAADLDSATALLRSLNTEITSTALRASMMDAANALFDRLAMLHLAAGRPEDALMALERGRVSTTRDRPPGPESFRPHLALRRGEVGVVYALVGDTLLIWTLGNQGTRVTRSNVDGDEILRTAERVRSALERRAAEPIREDIADLYDWLIQPIREQLGPKLLVVADGEIGGIPFPALYDAARERYLVEDHVLRFRGSLGDAAWAPQEKTGSLGLALLIADPAFDPKVFPGVDRLEGARAEVNALDALYPASIVLAGTEASARRLTAATRQVGIIHYAGHAVFDDTRPSRSFLLLTPTGDEPESGRLSAIDIEGWDLSHVRVVVLSACQTLRSRETHPGGFEGLAGAFLAAGAGGVVGSLWKVDDRFTLPLMVAFHRAFLRADDGAEALRQAQLQMLRSPDPDLRSPAAWAGFRYSGI